MNHNYMRISNETRIRASRALGHHYSLGRLDLDEFEGRCDEINKAQNVGDIERVFVDLPLPDFDSILKGENSGLENEDESYSNGYRSDLYLKTYPEYAAAEYLDYWDSYLGDTLFTRRKIKRIGWVCAIFLMIGIHSLHLGTFFALAPITFMIVVSIIMNPTKIERQSMAEARRARLNHAKRVAAEKSVKETSESFGKKKVKQYPY